MAKQKKEIVDSTAKKKVLSKPFVIEDSSDEEENSSITEQSESEIDPEEELGEEEEEEDGESTENGHKKLIDDDPDKYPIKDKLEILRQVRENNKRKTLSHTGALKIFDWSKVELEGYTTDDIKDCFAQVMKMTSKVRTLEEVIADYEQNYKKFELKARKYAPKMPRNAVMRYIDDNRDKLKKMYRKEHPSAREKIGLAELSPFGSHVFNTVISEKERAKYKQAYVDSIEAYKKDKKKYLKEHPELVPTKNKRAKKESSKGEKVKQPRKKKECAYITPYHLYAQSLVREGHVVAYSDSQKMYKALPDTEKLKFIMELVNDDDTTREKQFSKDEQKIIKYSCGVPKKPLSAYNNFVHDLSVKLKGTEDCRDVMKIAPVQWKNLDADEKTRYKNEHAENLVLWQEQAIAHINTLPKEQQVEQLAKHGLLQKVDRAGAKRRRQSIFVSEPDSKKQKITNYFSAAKNEDSDSAAVIKFVNINEIDSPSSSPSKKKKINNIETPVQSPTKKKKENNTETPIQSPSASPRKLQSPTPSPSKLKKEKSLSLSPVKVVTKKSSDDNVVEVVEVNSAPKAKKTKFKEFIQKLGEYPSLSVAHHFTTQYKGKASKIAKAYAKLSRNEKRAMLTEVNKVKMGYLGKLRKFVETEKKYLDKVKELHEKNKKEQSETISWYNSGDTDEDSSDSSDSDSD